MIFDLSTERSLIITKVQLEKERNKKGNAMSWQQLHYGGIPPAQVSSGVVECRKLQTVFKSKCRLSEKRKETKRWETSGCGVRKRQEAYEV